MSELPRTSLKRTALTSIESPDRKTLKRNNSQQESASTNSRPIKKSSVNFLKRQNSTFTTLFNEEQTIWTPKHWKKLEDWYILKNRDYVEAGKCFYQYESLVCKNGEVIQELWPIEKVLWRSKCLDTSTKRHGGLVPSERNINVSTPELSRTPTRTPDRTPISTPNSTPIRTALRTPIRTSTRSFIRAPSSSNSHDTSI